MKQKKDRQTIRLKGFDYSQEGWYFITICVKEFNEVFGEITEGAFIYNNWGQIVEDCWKETVNIREQAFDIDIFQIMPNHFHGIVVIGNKQKLPQIKGFPNTNSDETVFKSPTKTVGSMIRGFKASVTSKIQKLEQIDDLKLWQRNYYERIIRDENELNLIRKYIQRNPIKWQQDKELFKKLLLKMTKI